MTLTTTPQVGKENRIVDSTQSSAMRVLPHLVNTSVDWNAVTAVHHHFGHEGQPVETSLLIQSFKNFGKTPHLDQFARQETGPWADPTSNGRCYGPDAPLPGPVRGVRQPTFLARVPMQHDDATDGDKRGVCHHHRQQ